MYTGYITVFLTDFKKPKRRLSIRCIRLQVFYSDYWRQKLSINDLRMSSLKSAINKAKRAIACDTPRFGNWTDRFNVFRILSLRSILLPSDDNLKYSMFFTRRKGGGEVDGSEWQTCWPTNDSKFIRCSCHQSRALIFRTYL